MGFREGGKCDAIAIAWPGRRPIQGTLDLSCGYHGCRDPEVNGKRALVPDCPRYGETPVSPTSNEERRSFSASAVFLFLKHGKQVVCTWRVPVIYCRLQVGRGPSGGSSRSFGLRSREGVAESATLRSEVECFTICRWPSPHARRSASVDSSCWRLCAPARATFD